MTLENGYLELSCFELITIYKTNYFSDMSGNYLIEFLITVPCMFTFINR